jgi:hypothetical protein
VEECGKPPAIAQNRPFKGFLRRRSGLRPHLSHDQRLHRRRFLRYLGFCRNPSPRRIPLVSVLNQNRPGTLTSEALTNHRTQGIQGCLCAILVDSFEHAGQPPQLSGVKCWIKSCGAGPVRSSLIQASTDRVRILKGMPLVLGYWAITFSTGFISPGTGTYSSPKNSTRRSSAFCLGAGISTPEPPCGEGFPAAGVFSYPANTTSVVSNLMCTLC